MLFQKQLKQVQGKQKGEGDSGQDGSPQDKNNAATRQNAQDTITTF